MSAVVVTGGSGQLGAALVPRLLAEGHLVRVILRAGASHPLLPEGDVEIHRGSFLDADVLDRALAGASDLFHLAGVVSYSPKADREVYRVNVDGTVAAFEAALRAGLESFVLASSTMAVGATPGGPVADEASPFPASLYEVPYADSKRLAERYVLAGAARGLRAVAVNPSTIIGAGEKLGNFARLLRGARRTPLAVAPPGVIGVVDVEDAVEGLLLAWRHGQSGQRYIVNAENPSMARLLESINRAAGKPFRPLELPAAPLGALRGLLEVLRQVGMPVAGPARALYVGTAARHYSAERARRELGWEPRVGLDESMRRAAEYCARHCWRRGSGAGADR